MGVCTRNATEADADEIAALLGELGYSTEPSQAEHRLQGALRDPKARVLVAQLDDRLVGLIAAYVMPYFPDGSTILRITALVVSASYRRRGAGAALLAGALDFAAARGCSGVEITTAEGRLDAHAFYERLGFERTSLRFFRPLAP